jgi:hypothetical protein
MNQELISTQSDITYELKVCESEYIFVRVEKAVFIPGRRCSTYATSTMGR